MTKKYLIRVVALCGCAVMGLAAPKTVKADALPCTVAYLNQAKSAQAAIQQEVNAAKAELAAKQANLNALRASGVTSGIEYIIAVNEMESAQRLVESKISSLSNANSFVKDCTEKYIVEDNASKAYSALIDLNVMQNAKQSYDTAVTIAGLTSSQINNTKSMLAGYQAQLAKSPSVQAQINTLTNTLASLEASYQIQLADVNAKKAAYDASLNSNYASYDKSAIDYIYNRDNMRAYTVTDLNMDGVVDGNDYFIGVAYMQGNGGDHVFYNENYGGAR